MSVPPPIMPNLLNWGVYSFLNGSELKTVAVVSVAAHKAIFSSYGRGYNKRTLTAFGVSSQGNPKRLKRAESLAKKVSRQVGGPCISSWATAGGARSHAHPESQDRYASVYLNANVICLIAVLKKIPGTNELFRNIAAQNDDLEKYQSILKWFSIHAKEIELIESISIDNLKESYVMPYVQPNNFRLRGGKVLNRFPEIIIAYFKGLKKLTLCNNYLKSLSPRLADLALEELNLSGNQFEKMPPVIPTLKRLNLQNNPFIPFESIAKYIKDYAETGGSGLGIFLDGEYAQEAFMELSEGIQDTHQLKLFAKDGAILVVISENTEGTQPLS